MALRCGGALFSRDSSVPRQAAAATKTWRVGGPTRGLIRSYSLPQGTLRLGPMNDRDTKNRLSSWFHQWRSPLRKFLRSRGVLRTADLDDVAQKVFLRLMRYKRTELIENPQAYLYKMASNVFAEWAIRVRNTQPHESKWLVGLVAADQPEHEAGRNELQEEIEFALRRLSVRQREILKLQCYENLSRTEIAQRLGTTERSVKRVLMKSYEQLRLELNRELLGDITDGCE